MNDSRPSQSGSPVMDLNADVGERPDALSDDHAILRSITSANVACGFHAGDPHTMRFVCGEAAALGVAIGAHVSYLDVEGFGRRELDVPAETLAAQVAEQIGKLRDIAVAAGSGVRYVKPHGALYNRAARDCEVASAVVAGIKAAGGSLPVLSLPHSVLAGIAEDQGLEAIAEGFADRGYMPDGSLAPRSAANAVLEHDAALIQAVSMSAGKPINAIDGTGMRLEVRSLCLHSDTPGAAQLAADVREALVNGGMRVEAFT